MRASGASCKAAVKSWVHHSPAAITSQGCAAVRVRLLSVSSASSLDASSAGNAASGHECITDMLRPDNERLTPNQRPDPDSSLACCGQVVKASRDELRVQRIHAAARASVFHSHVAVKGACVTVMQLPVHERFNGLLQLVRERLTVTHRPSHEYSTGMLRQGLSTSCCSTSCEQVMSVSRSCCALIVNA